MEIETKVFDKIWVSNSTLSHGGNESSKSSTSRSVFGVSYDGGGDYHHDHSYGRDIRFN